MASTTFDNINAADTARRNSDFQWERKDSKVNYATLVGEAKDATEHEHNMSLFEAIRRYPKAVGWSVLASTALVMEGYDLVVIGSFYGYPTFQKKYGSLQPDGTYQISAAWESGLSNGAAVGEILGLMTTGLIAERYGYRKTIGMALFLVICFIFITFFAVNIQMLLVGEILCGIPWGVFQTITTAYAAEVTPVALRPYLTTYVNLCWVFGQFIGSGVLRGLLSFTDQWGYRIPFAIQWVWPVPLLIGIIFAPESPWWLVRKGRYSDAEKALKRLTTRSVDEFDPGKTIAMMIHTDEIEKETTAGASYWDCFRGTDFRRTEIACMVWMTQTFCGDGIAGYSTQFYEQAGLSTVFSFDLNMVQYAIGAVGVFCAWIAMAYLGRRTLYLIGLVGLDICLLIIGFVSLAPSSNKAAPWVTGSVMLIFTFIYDCTIGPVCYCLVAEIPSSRLRNKTIVLARNSYNIIGIFNNIVTPRMLNPTGWNWAGKSGFFWAGFCTFALVWTWFRLPEPKGKTFGELDILFERKVNARKFKSAVVDVFGMDVANDNSLTKLEGSGDEKTQVVMEEDISNI